MGMYGADVDQLRALARSFDTAATRLDQDRMTVGNAIRIQAWVGPVAVRFRAEWDSTHSAKVAGAAARLHAAARTLRQNADDQERTSMVNGANPGGGLPLGFPAPPFFGKGSFPGFEDAREIPTLLHPFELLRPAFPLPIFPGVGGWPGVLDPAAGGGSGNGTIQYAGGVLGVMKDVVGSIELPAGVVEMGHTAAHILLSGKGGEVWTKFGEMAEATKVGRVLGTVGSTLGVISTAFGTYETVTKALEGDTEGAIYSGVKTLIGAAAVIPSPIQPLAAAVSIGIGVGELLSQNPVITRVVTDVVSGAGEAIGRGVGDAVNTIGRAVDGAGKAAGSFLDGVGKAAKKMWPW